MTASPISQWRQAMTLTVWIAGLGYFVDLFDIAIFGVVRVASLKDLGLTDPDQILSAGILIYNSGMVGMMIGGLLWGVLADKKGRLSVLFGSILLYSLGNIANAFVWDVNSYALCRFITGIGLAGELGAAITLVAESLPKELRGIGTTIVATLGLLGSLCAAIVGQLIPWKAAYILGGVMGLALLAARVHMRESQMFQHQPRASSRFWGDVSVLLRPKLFLRYVLCVFLGIPIYFITGILFTFSPEIASALNVQGTVTAGNALLYGSVGLALGDFLSGSLSQILESRKKAILISLFLAACCVILYLLSPGLTDQKIYWLCLALGTFAGYWAVLITVAAEQFGTNIRGTVATTVPNFVRGSAVLCTLTFQSLKTELGPVWAALSIAAVAFGLATLAALLLRETFGLDLDYVEKVERTVQN